MTIDQLINTYPEFVDRKNEFEGLFSHFEETMKYKSIDCQSGWFPIILNCHQNLKTIYPEYRIVQIKEKFGGLRYYIAEYPENAAQYFGVNAVIRYAETLSFSTCESCGTTDYKSNVKIKGTSWVHTYCDKCEKTYMENSLVHVINDMMIDDKDIPAAGFGMEEF